MYKMRYKERQRRIIKSQREQRHKQQTTETEESQVEETDRDYSGSRDRNITAYLREIYRIVRDSRD